MFALTASAPRVAGLLSLILLAGCGTLNGTGIASLDAITREKGQVRDEETQRRRFREERDPDAMRWLLANRIASGMTSAEVEQIFGETGEREFNDRWLKASNGLYHEEDVVYKWGPDRNGRTVYLAFREGRLVNFDPEEYRSSATEKVGRRTKAADRAASVRETAKPSSEAKL